ncbi:MAG: protein translocase subunit SecD [Thermoleophilaceae bacterium]
MTSRTRNLSILGFVVLLLLAAAALIVPVHWPLLGKTEKPTRLGLDLKGGVELVYEGRPTPKVPKVTPQAIDDAITTIRKRTDALGVSEPEIQRAGANQISIGLPAVKNARRAIKQVGTTAQLQFYDWEPNVLGSRGPGAPYAGAHALYEAVQVASKQKPRAEATDIPPDEPTKAVERRFHGDRKQIEAYYDRKNDTATDKYYLFTSDQRLRKGPEPSCSELLSDYEPRPGPAQHYAKGTECAPQLKALGRAGPAAGGTVLKVPQGVLVVEADRQPHQPAGVRSYYVIEDDSELSGSDIKNPEQSYDQQSNAPIVTMQFTGKGRKAFARATKREAERGSRIILPPNTPREQAFQRFAITLDNKVISLATTDFVENPEGIDGRTGVQIENIGTLQEVQDLAEQLRIGALPINLKLISQTQVSATLGKQALHQGLIAGLVGLGLTILFLLLFYRVLGGVATLALLIYAFLLFALVKLIPITLTLPGIAGLVLTLAVAADANIVMYERIKEEVRAGRSIPAAISGGYSKALRTIIDANVVTIGVAFILFTLATAGVKGFAFTLGIGTLVSLFTAVLATSAVLGAMSRSRLLARPSALGVGKRQRGRWRFDFMGRSKWFFSMSGAILVAGALAIAGLGINFGIDFESGTRITTPLERPASVQQVRDVLSPLGYGDAKIQQINDKELGSNVVQISTRTLQPNRVNGVQTALNKRFGVRVGQFSSSSIGPTFGSQIARTALIAIIASLLLISIYIGFRFEFKYAVPVLIALAHDLLITAGVYALTEREVSTATVAALLTIMGYSLYDTVIVFDRIRENVPRMPRATFSQIANRAMSEVLTRSLATTFSALLPIGALLFFGGETLKDFAFALLVGVASGAYSSIFIATPVLVEWKEREPVYMRRRRVLLEEHGGVVPAFAEGVIGQAEEPGDGSAPAPRQRRPQRAGRRRAATPPVPGPTPPAAPPAAPSPPVAPPGGDGAPEPEPEPGGKDGAPRESRTTSTAGAGAAKDKKRRNRPKRKHGRAR